MAEHRRPAASGRGRARTSGWTGPLDERSGAALAKAVVCLADPDACPQRQHAALTRLAGHATIERDSFWRAFVLPHLPEHTAAAIDMLRHALIGHVRLAQVGVDLQRIERLLQLCRRICDARGPDATLVCLLDTVALCLCQRLLARPYLSPAETESLAELPEVADSINVLLGRREPWPAAMLEASLVILAHAENEGATAARRVVRHLPCLGTKAVRELAKPEALGAALNLVLAEPFVLGAEIACLTVGRIARRLIVGGHGDVLVDAMDLVRSGAVGASVATAPELITARNRMMAAILYELGALGSRVVRGPKGRELAPPPVSNVVLLSAHRRSAGGR